MNSSSARPAPLTKFNFDAEYDFTDQEDDIKSITPRTFKESTQASYSDGYQSGYAEGLRETNESINKVISEQFQALSYVEKTLTDFHQEVSAVIHAMAHKLFPVMMQAGAQGELNALFESILKTLDRTLHLKVYVCPENVTASQQRLMDLKEQHQFEGTIEVTADPALSPGDCRIDWDGGGIHQYLETSLREMDKMLQKFSGFKASADAPQVEASTPIESPQEPSLTETSEPEQEAQTIENEGDGQ